MDTQSTHQPTNNTARCSHWRQPLGKWRYLHQWPFVSSWFCSRGTRGSHSGKNEKKEMGKPLKQAFITPGACRSLSAWSLWDTSSSHVLERRRRKKRKERAQVTDLASNDALKSSQIVRRFFFQAETKAHSLTRVQQRSWCAALLLPCHWHMSFLDLRVASTSHPTNILSHVTHLVLKN